eukprot:m.172920 g.172920  ORF g.172920 m.172920 type:complete len:207 (+) comp39087_c0_seq31:134-754(+)
MDSALFTDSSFDLANLSSCWQQQRAVKDSSAQTSQIITNEKECQAVFRSEMEVQTEEDSQKSSVPFSEDNSQALLEFLKRIEPEVSIQLEKNLQSHAFDGYDVSWSDQSASVTCLHTLNHLATEELQCTDLSWNSTGSVIGIAYPKEQFESSCVLLFVFALTLCAHTGDLTMKGHPLTSLFSALGILTGEWLMRTKLTLPLSWLQV